MRSAKPRFRILSALSVSALLSGCLGLNPTVAPSIAQPDTRPARNFTSFNESLECMDNLFAKNKRRPILISSSDIPDFTSRIKVGADDMLINALSQMNRHSNAYIFVDQALIKFGGLLDIEVQNGDEIPPKYYIRGSISQLDSDVTNVTGSVNLAPATGGLIGSKYGPNRKLSVVSVDMHLVTFPGRRVLAGASVANSMVVVSKGFSTSASGLINMAKLGLSLQISRVESQSQAVRNLIEVGLIELLGRHAGVPYWTCLRLPSTDAKANGKDERRFAGEIDTKLLFEIQEMLALLGYLREPFEVKLGPETRAAVSRFQAEEKLLVNGIVDYDLKTYLHRKTSGLRSKGKTVRKRSRKFLKKLNLPAVKVESGLQVQELPPLPKVVAGRPKKVIPSEPFGLSCPGGSPGKPCDDGYVNLYDFLKNKN